MLTSTACLPSASESAGGVKRCHPNRVTITVAGEEGERTTAGECMLGGGEYDHLGGASSGWGWCCSCVRTTPTPELPALLPSPASLRSFLLTPCRTRRSIPAHASSTPTACLVSASSGRDASLPGSEIGTHGLCVAMQAQQPHIQSVINTGESEHAQRLAEEGPALCTACCIVSDSLGVWCACSPHVSCQSMLRQGR